MNCQSNTQLASIGKSGRAAGVSVLRSDTLSKQLQQRLRLAILGKLELAQQQQLRRRDRAQALDPQLVLQRGYALVRQNSQEIVRDSHQLKIGTELSIQLGRGQAKVTVIEINHGQKERVEL